jgi:hypothetical protein
VPRYRNAWVTTTAVLATVGVVVALLSWTWAGVLSAFAGTAVMGGGMTAALQPENTPRPWRRIAVGAVMTGVVVVGSGGLMVLLGPAAVPLVALAALSSPAVLSRVRGWMHKFAAGSATHPVSPDDPEALTDGRCDEHLESAVTGASVAHDATLAPEPPPEPSPEPETLDDDALCWAWRRSYVTLQQTRSPATRLRVVQVRQAYLDELERRNAVGLSAWLASGARAAGDPSRFIAYRSPMSPRRAE